MKYRLEVSKRLETGGPEFATLLFNDHNQPGYDVFISDMVGAMVYGLTDEGFVTHLFRINDTEEEIR